MGLIETTAVSVIAQTTELRLLACLQLLPSIGFPLCLSSKRPSLAYEPTTFVTL